MYFIYIINKKPTLANGHTHVALCCTMTAIYYKINHRQVRYTSYDQSVYTYC